MLGSYEVLAYDGPVSRAAGGAIPGRLSRNRYADRQ